jgi:hypothetical protein
MESNPSAMWASCHAREGGPDFWQLTRCHVEAKRHRQDPPIRVGEYQPRSTITLPQCHDIPLSISAGPVSASANVRTCERLTPSNTFGEWPSMRTTWEGRSYWATQKRETGQLWGISTPHGTAMPWLTMQWGIHSEMCNPPPSLCPRCPRRAKGGGAPRQQEPIAKGRKPSRSTREPDHPPKHAITRPAEPIGAG